ncbi:MULTISPECIES: type II toxin-antitoxin system HicB family antitoxin [Halorubrum]|uniref:HicB family protein n=1 Tax=Halorubrum hochstenium ATCC 700873 TaxID=1227481 RepID=M0FKV7_9EURY|nr:MULTISPECIES: hypothetical protein [Halorubrum]ELZ59927.1 hypothetical protein C467_02711 [Halorubrum hochstenium ATCC 700873]
MASSAREGDPREDEIRLWREGDGWVATDVETGVTTQGSTRDEALTNLDDAVALRRDEAGQGPTDEELREFGIDPDANETGDDAPPDVLE